MGSASGTGTSNPANATWGNSGIVNESFGAGSAANSSMNAGSTSMTGGNQPHNNLLPFLVVSFIIALQGVYPTQ
jgi:microcystin-dependent protein